MQLLHHRLNFFPFPFPNLWDSMVYLEGILEEDGDDDDAVAPDDNSHKDDGHKGYWVDLQVWVAAGVAAHSVPPGLQDPLDLGLKLVATWRWHLSRGKYLPHLDAADSGLWLLTQTLILFILLSESRQDTSQSQTSESIMNY